MFAHPEVKFKLISLKRGIISLTTCKSSCTIDQNCLQSFPDLSIQRLLKWSVVIYLQYQWLHPFSCFSFQGKPKIKSSTRRPTYHLVWSFWPTTSGSHWSSKQSHPQRITCLTHKHPVELLGTKITSTKQNFFRLLSRLFCVKDGGMTQYFAPWNCGHIKT